MKTEVIFAANILFMLVCFVLAFGLKSYYLFLIFSVIAFAGNVATRIIINRLK